ncbi:hypothetical protein ACFLY2_01100 [Patescibacteria group bacterium]
MLYQLYTNHEFDSIVTKSVSSDVDTIDGTDNILHVAHDSVFISVQL